jgi:hypothetical protein
MVTSGLKDLRPANASHPFTLIGTGFGDDIARAAVYIADNEAGPKAAEVTAVNSTALTFVFGPQLTGSQQGFEARIHPYGSALNAQLDTHLTSTAAVRLAFCRCLKTYMHGVAASS